MEIAFTAEAKIDLAYWKKTNNVKAQQRIADLLRSIQQDPFRGIGKPEALKHNLSGQWSRRIDKENRLIYEVAANKILVHSLKGHYTKK